MTSATSRPKVFRPPVIAMMQQRHGQEASPPLSQHGNSWLMGGVVLMVALVAVMAYAVFQRNEPPELVEVIEPKEITGLPSGMIIRPGSEVQETTLGQVPDLAPAAGAQPEPVSQPAPTMPEVDTRNLDTQHLLSILSKN